MLYYTISNEEAYTNKEVVKTCPFGVSCASAGVAEVALKGSKAASCGEQSTCYH